MTKAPRKKRGVPEPIEFADETTREVWERQKGEGDKAWQCFVTYRDAPYRSQDEGGPVARTQRMVSALLYPGRSPTSGRVREIADWSMRWRWVERVTAYDAHVDALKRAEFQKRLADDTELNIALLRSMRRKAASVLHEMPNAKVKAGEAVRMADVAITGLRREAGQATEIVGTAQDSAFAAWLTAGDDTKEEGHAEDPPRAKPVDETGADTDAPQRPV